MKRRNPTLVAALLVVCALIVLAVWGSSTRNRTSSSSSHFTSVTFNPREDEPRTLDVVVTHSEDFYATIHLVRAEGPPERLFPPLSTPADVPWPVPAYETVTITGKDGLAVPRGATGFLVLRMVDHPASDLVLPAEVVRSAAALEAALGAHVFDLGDLR